MSTENGSSILYGMPHALLRYGATALLATVLVLLIIGWLVRWPDTVEAPFTLVNARPAAPVVARSAGPLALEVEDGTPVDAGAWLGSVATPGDPEAILALGPMLDGTAGAPSDATLASVDPAHLGPLQPVFAELLQAAYAFRVAADTVLRESRRNQLVAEREYLRDRIAVQDSVNAALALELELAVDLLERQVIAGEEAGAAQVLEVERRQDVAQAQRALLAGRLEALRLEQQLREAEAAEVEYERRWRREVTVARHEVTGARARLRARWLAWRDETLLSAPVAGTVALFDRAADGLPVSPGDTVLTVVPPESELLARIEIPARTVGRIAVNQEVRLHFDAFPALAYGVVEGRVARISAAPRSDIYFVGVELTDGLLTDTGHRLPSWSGEVGEARIVTRDRSLLARVVGWGG